MMRLAVKRILTLGFQVEHGVTHRDIGVEVALIGDVDLVAMTIDDQVDIPAPHDGGAMAIDVAVFGVGGTAEILPDAAGQPDAPAGGLAALDLLHFGVAFWGSMPDVLGGQ